MSATTPSAPSAGQLRALLWLVAVGFFMQTLDATIVNTALPSMALSLGVSPLRMQSVVVAYSLAMAMLIPASGWLADRFGLRSVFLGAIALFSAGSLLCALSNHLTLLVAARVIQGLGGALLLPVGRLALLKVFPRERFLQAMSFVAIPGLIGPLIGPTLGGWIVEFSSWHWIFLINLPVGLLGGQATLRYMPRMRNKVLSRFDLTGYLLLAFGMVTISLALDGLSGLGLRQASMLVLMIFGLASLTAYWMHALRRPDPLFSPRLFRVATLRIGLLGNLFSRLGSTCMPLMIPLLMQVTMGYTPMQAGLLLLPVTLASMSMKRPATWLLTHYGYRRVLVLNTLLVGLATASFALVMPDQPLWLRVLQLMVFGAVNSVQFTAMNTLTLKDLGPTTASSGNSLLSMVQMLALGMGVAVAGAVLAAFTAYFGHEEAAAALPAFRGTFVCMGLITMTSAAIFWQLSDTQAAAPRARREPAELE
jgi:EmrB/QacA subfamily drug resistance transporter